MASRDPALLDARLQPLWAEFEQRCNANPVFEAAGATVFLTCTWRSNSEQAEDLAKGRDADGNVIDKAAVVTDEPPGHSAHNCTLADGTPAARAFDFSVKLSSGVADWSGDDPLWQTAISVGLALGLVSGSQWKSPCDRPHLELADWRSL